MPAVIHPRRVGDADLAQHLRGEMQQGEGFVVVLDAELGPIAHPKKLSTPLHFSLPRG
jgi:hypothetical protein